MIYFVASCMYVSCLPWYSRIVYCVPVLEYFVKKFLKKKCEKEKALYVPPVYTVVIRWYIVVYIVVYVYDKK